MAPAGPGGVGPEVEDRGHQIGATDSVHHAVMHLREERPAAVARAPRAATPPTAAWHGPDAGRRCLAASARNCSLPARRGHSGVPHVIADLEVLVVHPHRAEDLQRHGPHHLAVARHQRQLRGQQPDEVVVGWARAPRTPRASPCASGRCRARRRRTRRRACSSVPWPALSRGGSRPARGCVTHGRLRPSRSCACHPFVRDDRRAQRDLAAQHRGGDDLGEFAAPCPGRSSPAARGTRAGWAARSRRRRWRRSAPGW